MWVYGSFEEKRYGWTHIDKFTARHDMLYDKECDLWSAKKYLFAKNLQFLLRFRIVMRLKVLKYKFISISPYRAKGGYTSVFDLDNVLFDPRNFVQLVGDPRADQRTFKELKLFFSISIKLIDFKYRYWEIYSGL